MIMTSQTLQDLSEDQRRLQIVNRAEQRYRDLKIEAYYEPGLKDNYDPTKAPSWFDINRYEQCLYLARKYFVSLFTAHFIGLLMIIQIPSGLAPLLATGNSTTVAKLFRRYLSTLIHVKSWYESNPFERKTTAFESLQKVRSMHKRVQQLMNSRPKNSNIKDKLWLNQYDFVMTQWAFVGPVVLYPNDCGLRPAKEEELKDLYYLWRVIGHCIGIEDKYNLCSGNVDEDRELCRLLFDRDYRPVIQDTEVDNKIGWHMGNGIALAIQMVNPSISFPAVINYWYPRLDIPHKPKLNSLFHKFSYYYMLFNFQVMLRFSLAHWLYGWMYRFLIGLAVKRKQIRETFLKQKYTDIKYEEKCPLNSIDIDYSDAFNDKI